MKYFRRFLIFSILLLGIVYYSCDDSGVTPPNVPTGQVTFTPVNMKQINQANDGIFELWAKFDSAAPTWLNLGRFNLNASGGIISESGGSMSFSFGGDTLRMNKLSLLLVTIEAPGVNNPSPGITHLMSSPITNSNIYLDSISAALTISDANSLDSVGSIFLADTGRGFFYLASPSTNNVNCSQGVWLCDQAGNNGFPPGLNLDPNGGWQYKMWVLNNITVSYSYCGSFFSMYGPDNDSAGPCRGAIDTFYNAPGQDFIQNGNGCTSIGNIDDGNHGLLISIEPVTRSDNSHPFFFTVYNQGSSSGGCNTLHQIPKQQASLMPHGRVVINVVRK